MVADVLGVVDVWSSAGPSAGTVQVNGDSLASRVTVNVNRERVEAATLTTPIDLSN